MQTTNQRKRVILLAAAFLAVGVLAASAEARPNKAHRRAAKTQHRDRNRGHPRVAQRRHKGRDRDKSGVSISFDLGGHGRTKWVRPRLTGRNRGHYEARWIPSLYGTRYDECGHRYEVVIRDGYWTEVWTPRHRPKHRHGHKLHRCSAGCHDRRPDSGVTIRGHIRF